MNSWEPTGVPKILIPKFTGRSPAAFHTRVFPRVQLHSGLPRQNFCECIEGSPCSPWRGRRVHVIEERKQLLVLLHASLHVAQRIVDGKAEEQGQQRVSLFPLPYWVLHPSAVPPPVTRPFRVQRLTKGNQSMEAKLIVQVGQHLTVEHMVAGTDSVNGHHSPVRVQIRVCSRLSGKGKLEHILDFMNRRAKPSETNRLKEIVVAIPQVPPSSFINAVMVA